MVTLNSVVCLLALLPQVPDEPSDPPPAESPAILNAHLLPRDTLAAIALNPIGPHREALAESGLATLLDDTILSGESGKLFDVTVQGFSQIAGIEPKDFDQLIRNGAVLALTGIHGDQPDWIFALDAGEFAPQVTTVLAKLRVMLSLQGWRAESTEHFETKVWTLRNGGMTIAHATYASWAFFGSTSVEIQNAIDRAAGRTEHSLRDDATYELFELQARSDSQGTAPLLTAYCNTEAFIRRAIEFSPAIPTESANTLLEDLAIDGIGAVGYSVTPEGGQIRERFIVDLPAPRMGIWAALFPEADPIEPSVANLVPSDVMTFCVSNIDLGRLLTEIIQVIESQQPGFEAMAQQLLVRFERQVGVNLQEDILAGLDTRIVTLQWEGWTVADPMEQVLIFSLNSSRGIRDALDGLGPLMRTPLGEFIVYRPAPGAGMASFPGFAVSDSMLMIASSPDRAIKMVRHLESPAANPSVEEIISATPERTVALGWSDVSRQLKSLLKATPTPPPHEIEQLLTALGDALGKVRFAVTVDRRGFVVETRSAAGVLPSLCVSGWSAAKSLMMGAPGISPGIGQLSDKSEQQAREVIDTVTEALQRQRYAKGYYGDLDSLIADSLVDARTIGAPEGPGVRRVDDFLLCVLRPTDTDDHAQHFAVVMWPADKQRGDVYLRTDQGDLMRNDLLARVTGLDRVSNRDVFKDAVFGSPLTAGWRRVEGKTSDPVALETPTTRNLPRDRRNFAKIVRLEAEGSPKSEQELLEFLKDENPKIVARACFALGQLGTRPAAPPLADLVTGHADLEVRQQAMAALLKIRDRRSVRASIFALSSSDEKLRALAAANLGKLRAREGQGALSALLADRKTAKSTGTDRVQALLALADIGDPIVLVPTAASVGSDNPDEEKALAYVFQTLSSKLEPPQEVTTLLAVLDHDSVPLKRYAIERLGELADPVAVEALEKRVAVEEPAMRALVERSLEAIRGVPAAEGGIMQRVNGVLAQLSQLGKGQRAMIMLIALGGLAAIVGLLFVVRRSRRQRPTQDWSSMVAPSEEGYDDAAYDGDANGEYADGEYVEGEYAEGEYGDGEYADAGYADGEPAADGGSFDEFAPQGDAPEGFAQEGDAQDGYANIDDALEGFALDDAPEEPSSSGDEADWSDEGLGAFGDDPASEAHPDGSWDDSVDR